MSRKRHGTKWYDSVIAFAIVAPLTAGVPCSMIYQLSESIEHNRSQQKRLREAMPINQDRMQLYEQFDLEIPLPHRLTSEQMKSYLEGLAHEDEGAIQNDR
jgi:hypothetical protein